MSFVEQSQEGCFTFMWKIENFSKYSSLLMVSQHLRSTVWKTNCADKISWWILDAIFSNARFKFTLRCLEAGHPYDSIQMCILTADGEVALTPGYTDDHRVSPYSIQTNSIFRETRESCLPQDTLTVFCRIRSQTLKHRQFLLRTVLHYVDFPWNTSNYDMDSDWTQRVVHQQDTILLIMALFKKLIDSRERGTHRIRVVLQSNVGSLATLVNCKISIPTSRGRVFSNDCVYPCVEWTSEVQMHNPRLDLEVIQMEFLVAVHMEHQQLVMSSDPIADGSSNILREDLLHLYRERILSDATLNTDWKSFQAHRSILAARSPVFRAMFEKEETTEGRSGVVDIDDLEGGTVDRMLKFMYSDYFEEMRWEEASSLYYAADKYAILPLKQKCLEVLRAGLDVDNACDALVLADRHSDEDLMKFTVDFVRDHEDVISSSEWSKLENSNSLLTSKVLREVILKKKCKKISQNQEISSKNNPRRLVHRHSDDSLWISVLTRN